MKLEVSCFPKAPRRPMLKRPLALDERFGSSKKSWWFTLTPRSLFFLAKCELKSFHILLSLTPLLVFFGTSYSALPETFTRIGSPPPPDYRSKRIMPPALVACLGTATDDEIPPALSGLEELGEEVWSTGAKNEVPKGVAKAAA